MRRARWLTAVPLVCLPVLAQGCDSTDPAARELVVYTTLRPPNQDISLVDPAGEGPRRLTDHLGLDYNPAFSPDGEWLVVTSERHVNTDLYALNLEPEGEPVRLTRHRGMDDAADISGDGEEIVFVSTRAGNADVHVMPFRPGALRAALSRSCRGGACRSPHARQVGGRAREVGCRGGEPPVTP